MNLAIGRFGLRRPRHRHLFAEVGHNVICVDNDLKKVETLRAGQIPIYEPGLEDLIKKNVKAGRLSFTSSIGDAVAASKVIFIAVPTPPQPDGSVDLSFVEGVAREIAVHIKEYRIVVDNSTVPVKTGEKSRADHQPLQSRRRHRRRQQSRIPPRRLRRRGSHEADRIVVGVSSERAIPAMREIYEPFKSPIMFTDLNSAELIKHAANSFLALKISYINAVAAICEASGANVERVADGMGADKRIGRAFLNAGIGYGGSCFPKDISAFIRISRELGYQFHLLEEVEKINANQKERFLKKIRDSLWVLRAKKIGCLGLAFKGNTDDVRSSVAIEGRQATRRRGRRSPRLRSQGHGESRPARPRRQNVRQGRGRRRRRRLASSSSPSGPISSRSITPRSKRACSPHSSSTVAIFSIPRNARPRFHLYRHRSLVPTLSQIHEAVSPLGQSCLRLACSPLRHSRRSTRQSIAPNPRSAWS